MKENKYELPDDSLTANVVAEPAPTAVEHSLSVQKVRHTLIDAIYSSEDVDKLYMCLVILNGKSMKTYQSKYRTKTDEELSAELSQFPSWDEKEHPDLTNVDYRQYKHKKSLRTIKAIYLWLFYYF